MPTARSPRATPLKTARPSAQTAAQSPARNAAAPNTPATPKAAAKRIAPARSAKVSKAPSAAEAPKAPPAAAPAAAAEPTKAAKSKTKLVRDSFTMPQADFELVAALKQRAVRFERPAKKSELLRAGLHALAALNDTKLRAALDALTPLKPGRPKKGG